MLTMTGPDMIGLPGRQMPAYWRDSTWPWPLGPCHCFVVLSAVAMTFAASVDCTVPLNSMVRSSFPSSNYYYYYYVV